MTFQENISYSEALKKGRAQDKAILNLLAQDKINEDASLQEKLHLVNKETQEILEEDAVLKTN